MTEWRRKMRVRLNGHSRLLVVGTVLLRLAVEVDQLHREDEAGDEENKADAQAEPETVLQ